MSLCCCSEDDYQKEPIGKPRPRKTCTDCFCFLLFIVFLIGMALITLVVVLDDGFDRLRFGYDSFGNLCDRKNPPRLGQINYATQDTTGLTNVLYFNYLKPTKSLKACVQSCPNRTIVNLEEFKKYSYETQVNLCLYNVTLGNYDPKLCPSFPIFSSVSVLNRCIPTPNLTEILPSNINTIGSINITNIVRIEDIRSAALNLYKQLPDIGLLTIAATIITIVLVFLLRYVAHLMVVIVILLSILGSLGLTVFLWLKFHYYYKLGTVVDYIVPLLDIQTDAKTAFLVYSIIVSLFTLILLLILIATRKRIFLLLKLFAESQKALADMPLLFTIPLITFMFLIMFLFYWLLTAIMLYSFGEYDQTNLVIWNIQVPKRSLTKVMWAYHIVGLVWISEFIFGCQSMIIAKSVAKWYFTRNKKHFKSPICLSIVRLIVYHLGSVAFGSFLIVLVRIPRYILMYLAKDKTKPSPMLDYCRKMCICFTYCLEKFIKFVNYNAYVVIAIQGKSFCTSAQIAFNLIIENSFRIAIINSFGDFILFLSKLTVTILTLILAVFWLRVPIENPLQNIEEYKLYFLPLLIIAIISFLIAHSFFTVYEMVIDAILICFCEDIKANDGSESRPYYMSSSLKKFIDESSTTIINVD